MSLMVSLHLGPPPKLVVVSWGAVRGSAQAKSGACR